MKKFLFLPLLLIPLLGFIFVKSQPYSISISPSNTVTVHIYSESNTRTFIEKYTASQSAFTVLQSVTTKNNIPLTFKKYSFGTLVESINGLQNTKDKAWIYFVNGQSASVGADQYQVQLGDVIDWKYLTPQF